jgi:hypothetical protein
MMACADSTVLRCSCVFVIPTPTDPLVGANFTEAQMGCSAAVPGGHLLTFKANKAPYGTPGEASAGANRLRCCSRALWRAGCAAVEHRRGVNATVTRPLVVCRRHIADFAFNLTATVNPAPLLAGDYFWVGASQPRCGTGAGQVACSSAQPWTAWRWLDGTSLSNANLDCGAAGCGTDPGHGNNETRCQCVRRSVDDCCAVVWVAAGAWYDDYTEYVLAGDFAARI